MTENWSKKIEVQTTKHDANALILVNIDTRLKSCCLKIQVQLSLFQAVVDLQALVLAKFNEGCVDAKVTISGTSGDMGMFFSSLSKVCSSPTNSRRA